MCPWYLVTDHGHYGRWLPIFVADMKKLKTRDPQTYEEFKKGHFTSRQTNKAFSCISDDQLHEQNNKMVKESSSLLGTFTFVYAIGTNYLYARQFNKYQKDDFLIPFLTLFLFCFRYA